MLDPTPPTNLSERNWEDVEATYALGEGFELCFLFEDAEIDALAEVRRRLAKLANVFERIAFKDPEDASRRLRAMATQVLDASSRAVVWVDSVAGDTRTVWQPLIADLNQNREWFRKNIDALIVIAGTRELEDMFRTFGPDVWSIRGTTRRFTEPLWLLDEAPASEIERAARDFKELSHRRHTIAGHSISRPETETILELLRRGHSVLCVAPAGHGKSAVLAAVSERLDEEALEGLLISADRLPPGRTPEKMLEEYGLEGSPAHLLRQLMALHARRRGVLLIDQLDDLSEFAGDAERMELYQHVSELIDDTLDHRSLSTLIACRPFDLKYDSRFERLEEDERLRVIELEPLSDASVHEVIEEIGYDPDILTAEQLDLLRSPLHLQLLATIPLEPGGGLPMDVLDLYERYWDAMRRRFEAVFGEYTWIDSMRGIIEEMEEAQSDRIPKETSHLSRDELDWLLSQGVLREVSATGLSFFHGAVTDYVFARSTEEGLVEHLLRGIQPLRVRRRVRVMLSHQRRRERARRGQGAYIQTLRELFFHEDVRAHIKYTAASFLCDVGAPLPGELDVISELMQCSDPFLARQGARILARNALMALEATAAGGWRQWLDLACERQDLRWLGPRLAEHAMRHDTPRALKMFEHLLANEERWGLLREALGDSGLWSREEALSSFVLRAIELGVWFEAGREGPFWYHLPKQNPSLALRIVSAVLRQRAMIVLQRTEEREESLNRIEVKEIFALPFRWTELHKAIRGDDVVGVEVVHQLLPVFLELLERSTNPEPPHRSSIWRYWWSESKYPDGSDVFLSLVKNACASHPEVAATHLEHLTACPAPLARHLRWTVWASSSSQEEMERAVRELRARIRAHESLKAFFGLEAAHMVLCEAYAKFDTRRWADLLDEVLSHYPTHEKPRAGARASSGLGLEQMRLLENLPPESLSNDARTRLAELRRRFPDDAAPLATPAIGPAQFITYEASDVRGHEMSDQDWLEYLSKQRQSSGPFEQARTSAGPALRSHTQEAPERFLKMLVDHFDTSIDARYFDAILWASEDAFKEGAEVPRELLLEAVRGSLRAHPHSTVRGCLWAMKHLSSPPPDDIVERLVELSAEGEDFEPRPNGEEGDIRRLAGAALDDAPGAIMFALARWVHRDREFFERHRDMVSKLSTSEHDLLLTGLSEVALFCLNHDREFAVRTFLEIARHASDTVLATPSAMRFFSYTLSIHEAALWPIATRLLTSKHGELREQGGILLVWRSLMNDAIHSESLKEWTGASDDTPLCKGVARALRENREFLEEEHLSAWLELCHHDDEEVLKLAASLFSTHAPDGFLERHLSYAEQFITTRAFEVHSQDLFRSLLENDELHTEVALSACEAFVSARSEGEVGHPSARFVVDLLIRLYRENAQVRGVVTRVMDMIDELIEAGFYDATRVLEETEALATSS